jgi:DMSO/TMAO reductase YedYZ molybdopterin-dependent catalytic subunit
LLGAAVAVGVGQLVAGVSVPAASPVLAVGQASIGLMPGPVTDWAKQSFGTADKDVLITGVVVVLGVLAAVFGALAVRRLAYGMGGLALLALAGVVSAVTRPGASPGWALPTLIGAVAGAFALDRLVTRARVLSGTTSAPAPASAAPGDPAGSGDPSGFGNRYDSGDRYGSGEHELRPPDLPGRWPDGPDAWVPGGAALDSPDWDDPPFITPSSSASASSPAAGPSRPASPPPAAGTGRRSFLLASGATLAVAAAGELGGRYLATRKNVSAAQATIHFPRPSVSAPPLPAGVNLPVRGISPFITPNSQFYRVDTALVLPEVDPSNWQLRIHGMVGREITLSFADLLRRPLIEDYITLTCVSDPVSGPYAGNAKWLGASLAALLKQAGIKAGASQLLCTSVDGFTSGTPAEVVMDGRDALVAVAMNGTALPVAHGFPARLVVSGLYGYVSATKWVTDIEVTTFQDATAYWVQQGWAQQGPIKTESRIDVPASGAVIKGGRVPVAGVAWAQHKGIEAVEVQIDRGPWRQATLADVPGLDTWRQWVYHWDATPGNHTIQARATDKTGYTQTAIQEPTVPNGATGYPVNTVTII